MKKLILIFSIALLPLFTFSQDGTFNNFTSPTFGNLVGLGITDIHPKFESLTMDYDVRASFKSDMLQFFFIPNPTYINTTSGAIPLRQQTKIRTTIKVPYTASCKYGKKSGNMIILAVQDGDERNYTIISLSSFFTKGFAEYGRDGKNHGDIAKLIGLRLDLDVTLKISDSKVVIRKIIESKFPDATENSDENNSSGSNSNNQNSSNSNNSSSSNSNNQYSSNSNNSSNSNTTNTTNTNQNSYANYNAAKNKQAQSRPKTKAEKQRESIERGNAAVARNNAMYENRNAANSNSKTTNNSSGTNSNSTNRTGNSASEQRQKNIEQAEKFKASQDKFWDDFDNSMKKREKEIADLEYFNKRNIGAIASYMVSTSSQKINISDVRNASNPREVIASMQRVKDAVANRKAQISNNYVNTLNFISSNTPTTKAQANSNLTAAGLATGVAIAQAAEAKKAQKEAERVARLKLDNMRSEINSAYNKALNSTLKQAVYSKNSSLEDYALEQHFYYKCLKDDMNSRFSYSNGYWATPSSSCREPSSFQKQRDNSTNLQVAERKMQLFLKYNHDGFKTAALGFAQESINKKENLPGAYAFKAQYSQDIIEQYGSIIYSKKLSKSRNYKYQSLYNQIETNFNKIFYKAVEDEDIAFLTRSLESTLYPDKANSGNTPIEYSIMKDKRNSLSTLLKYNSKIKTASLQNYLLTACKYNSENVFDYFMEKQVPFKKENYKKFTPLEVAFFNEAEGIFSKLISYGADFKSIKKRKSTAEGFAFNMARMLIVSAIQNKDNRLIYEADKFYNLGDVYYFAEIVKDKRATENKTNHILSARIQNKDISDSEGKTLLHHAIINNNYPFFKALLDQGYPEDIRDKSSKFPIEYINQLSYNNSKILQMLKQTNMNKNVVSKEGVPLMHSLMYSQRNFFETLLVGNQFDVNIQGKNDWTALHYAARDGDYNTCNLLLANGADKYITDKWGRTPFHVARERKGSQLNGQKVSNRDYNLAIRALRIPLKARRELLTLKYILR